MPRVTDARLFLPTGAYWNAAAAEVPGPGYASKHLRRCETKRNSAWSKNRTEVWTTRVIRWAQRRTVGVEFRDSERGRKSSVLTLMLLSMTAGSDPPCPLGCRPSTTLCGPRLCHHSSPPSRYSHILSSLSRGSQITPLKPRRSAMM